MIMQRLSLCFLLGMLIYAQNAIASPIASSNDTSTVENAQSDVSSLVRAIDVFGTSQITTEQVRKIWGKKLIQYTEVIYSKNTHLEVAQKLVELAKQTKYHKLLIDRSAPILLKMLKLEQPNNHNPAYMILTTLSGEHYGKRDYAAWERWVRNSKKSVKNDK